MTEPEWIGLARQAVRAWVSAGARVDDDLSCVMHELRGELAAHSRPAWEDDPRRRSTDPRERAAWLMSSPGDRKRYALLPSDEWCGVSDGWGLLVWPGEQIDHDEWGREQRSWQRSWRTLVTVKHQAIPVDPVRVTYTEGRNGTARCYRIGPAVFDADRVEEWVPVLGPALPPPDASSPALWMGDGWIAVVMPIDHDPSFVVAGWDEEDEDA